MINQLIILNNWEKAKLAVAQCTRIDVLKDIRDRAEAVRAYYQQAKDGLEVQNNAADIKLRAERRIGELSRELPIKQGNRSDLTSSHDGKKLSLKQLGIQHHERYEAIASLPEKEFEKHIQEVKASNQELTTMGVVRLARQLKRPQPTETPELPEKKYRIIYADPPWSYGNSGLDEYGHAERHYPTMAIEEICALPVKDITEENAVLFLWVTSPVLEDAFKIINSWGFKYKTSFVWDKVKHNFGYYNSVRHEFLLVATKHSCLPDEKKLYDSVISIERTKHSEKPEYFRNLIDKLYTSGRRIELFARKKIKNWDNYGNEI
ncbi:hypothetical protein COV56_02710 [Candidatus Kuenenbacteria bacterium CG11_big_fil_rev_8_21_14_0_20_37_9]|uniref:DNA methyltransferase n=1 Tax=Candidatus Kuenenbacteria bacterium CG08_land_8_20_14_0_20_37_23 TaxID=1974617 RepID=A0A2M6XSI5_9BACT|nr:MAG: hypothetical protein COV56_02710 [Candidatus Kuenenbacteria bacterium CG11_big_fil_rev_8_21_14_0_20_37_9]PIU10561.1 MAG: hypothetical protein COT27_02545 [Candidatus Kuenenbacteria bacterium CG08_land_8_20_14_0_20_37_23]